MGPFLRRQAEGARLNGPALGLIECSSVARGLVVVDAMVKRAPVELVLARPVSPGKHVALVAGEVAEVEEAMLAGIEAAGGALVDSLELAQVAESLLVALRREAPMPSGEAALGIVETLSVASSLLAADTACKAAEVALCEIRLADGLGGKGYFILTGVQADIEAALAAAVAVVPRSLFLEQQLIARPHDDLITHLLATLGSNR